MGGWMATSTSSIVFPANDFVKFTFEWISPHINQLNNVDGHYCSCWCCRFCRWLLACANIRITGIANDAIANNKDIMYLRLFHLKKKYIFLYLFPLHYWGFPYSLGISVWARARSRSMPSPPSVWFAGKNVLSFHMIVGWANWRGENYKRLRGDKTYSVGLPVRIASSLSLIFRIDSISVRETSWIDWRKRR